ncbi:MAG: TatD family hydrolase, partial [Erysipelotrichia bacterium]|nr:TatD family hydrolase [Erysipelotrichia bacterium]
MIDSHCHLNDKRFSENVEQVIKRAKENGVKKFLVVGYDLVSSTKAVKLSEKYNEVYAAVGIHPSDVKKMKTHDLDEIEALLKNKKVLAVGEIGLDYYWDKEQGLKNEQKEFFVKQIQLANKHQKPIVVHMR